MRTQIGEEEEKLSSSPVSLGSVGRRSRSVKPTETRRVVVRQRGGVTTRRRGRALAVNALLRRTTWDSASLSVPVAAAAAAGPFVEQMMRTMMNTLRHPPSSSPTHCRATHMCCGGGEIRLGQGCDGGGGGGGGRSAPKVALLLDTTTAFPLQMERNTVAVGRSLPSHMWWRRRHGRKGGRRRGMDK